jgi:hypothetical protein
MMTAFQEEMLKILVDKALLGAIAMVFGYYLSKRLEMLRTQKTYELFVWEKRAEASQAASRQITRHSLFFRELVAFIPEQAKNLEKNTEKRAALLKEFGTIYPAMQEEMQSIIPFLPPRINHAVSEYLGLWAKVERILKSGVIDPSEFPKPEDVVRAASKFGMEVGRVFENGPQGKGGGGLPPTTSENGAGVP